MAAESVMTAKGRSLIGGCFLDEIGGRDTVVRVHDILYTKLFAHPWLKAYFVNSTRSILQSQQDDFWTGLMGGPKRFGGRSPRDAHIHMYIPADAFAIRHELLGEAIDEAGVAPLFRDQWLALDDGFARAVTSKSIEDVVPRFKTDDVIIPARPPGFEEPKSG
ncbi:MAG: group 1 truncated hemoglobin [Proteobacteria bacterium]|nr:group 1 truncated hemoglobin [Pseudomonadota bacterium]